MTNDTKIFLDKEDIQNAINAYVAKQYPNFNSTKIWIQYDANYKGGFTQGTIREGR